MEYSGASDNTLIVLGVIAIIPSVLVTVLNWRNHKETRFRIAENTQETRAVRDQVQNDHNISLRDDIDGFKRTTLEELREVSRQLRSIKAAQGYLGGVVGNILGDIRKFKDTDLKTATAIEELQTAVKPLQETLDKYQSQQKDKS